MRRIRQMKSQRYGGLDCRLLVFVYMHKGVGGGVEIIEFNMAWPGGIIQVIISKIP